MEGDECSFPPDSSDDHSLRGSVASSATLSRGMMSNSYFIVQKTPKVVNLLLLFLLLISLLFF